MMFVLKSIANFEIAQIRKNIHLSYKVQGAFAVASTLWSGTCPFSCSWIMLMDAVQGPAGGLINIELLQASSIGMLATCTDTSKVLLLPSLDLSLFLQLIHRCHGRGSNGVDPKVCGSTFRRGGL